MTLLPSGRSETVAALLARLDKAPRLLPFEPRLIAALDRVSTAILGSAELRQSAEAVSLGFWLRRANLTRLEQDFRERERPDRLLVPAGLSFHIPPANVDTIFAYSWALAMLCGNASIIRLSSRASILAIRLVEIIIEALGDDLVQYSAFITYGRDEAVTAALSAGIDLRIVWGGDQSVAAIRAIPLAPQAREIAFADRVSLSVLDAASWLGLDEAAQAALAQRSYADIMGFDQMACSSPRVLVWRGTREAVARASAGFDNAMRAEIRRRGYQTSPAVALGKFAAACRAAIDGDVAGVSRETLGWVVIDLGDTRPIPLPSEPTGGGLVYQMRIDGLNDLLPLITRRVQTMTYFGIAGPEVAAFARELAGRGIDRFVPVGEALAFSALWDGNDLLAAFTRVVAVAP